MQGKDTIIVALDQKGHKVVVMNHILFYGKKNMPWKEVEKYLRRYIGKIVTVAETGEEIHIGPDFPNEYKGSNDTLSLRGQYAKAKANAIQGIEEMISISKKVREEKNLKKKNKKKAPYGWYRYTTRFALPVVLQENVINYYNVYIATLIVRKDKNKKLFLYDVVHIKKESSVNFIL